VILSVAVTTASDTRQAIDAVWRIESPRVIAGLARLVRDVGVAEELAQDALVAALEQWPSEGVPDNPGAWLMATAKHRALDTLRRRKLLKQKHAQLEREAEIDLEAFDAHAHEDLDDDIGDDLLRLIFTACHPVLSTEARVALTLRLLGGLTTEEIARAFLVPESTIAQRIVRAKRSLADAKVGFEAPRGDELAERLASVLEVIYLIFNEGYAATAGDDWMRPALCEDAIRLGRVLAGLAPRESEVHGLVALLEIQQSRTHARTNAAGEPVLLLDQDRSRWDHLLIRRGLASLARAEELAAGAPGPYVLQALVPSPVVELNRAVAVSMALGPEAALDIVDRLADEPLLREYHLLPSVRGELLRRLGRFAEAAVEFTRAAELARNARERELLLTRARTSVASDASPR
jgi:RNA polymerase sigma factor (sigma-70 family)